MNNNIFSCSCAHQRLIHALAAATMVRLGAWPPNLGLIVPLARHAQHARYEQHATMSGMHVMRSMYATCTRLTPRAPGTHHAHLTRTWVAAAVEQWLGLVSTLLEKPPGLPVSACAAAAAPAAAAAAVLPMACAVRVEGGAVGGRAGLIPTDRSSCGGKGAAGHRRLKKKRPTPNLRCPRRKGDSGVKGGHLWGKERVLQG